jgi:hypothetical protein
MKGQTYLIGLVALGVTWRLAAQNVGIGTSAPAARLHVQTPSTDDFIRTGWFQNQRDAADNNGVLIDIARAATDAYALDVRSGVGASLTSRLYVRGDGNVGIGTTAPEARLHVNGRAIVDDGTTGTPTNSTWGSAGSRIILWPGSATETPYQIGIAPAEMWTGVPSGASWSVFRGTDRQLIVRPTMRIGSVGGSTNFPSIMIGNLNHGTPSSYPKRGTFVYFGGPTNDYESNTDEALMYHIALAPDQTRLRLHVEDNGGGAVQDGFSILGASCGGGCHNLAASSLLFDFVSRWSGLQTWRRQLDSFLRCTAERGYSSLHPGLSGATSAAACPLQVQKGVLGSERPPFHRPHRSGSSGCRAGNGPSLPVPGHW